MSSLAYMQSKYPPYDVVEKNLDRDWESKWHQKVMDLIAICDHTLDHRISCYRIMGVKQGPYIEEEKIANLRRGKSVTYIIKKYSGEERFFIGAIYRRRGAVLTVINMDPDCTAMHIITLRSDHPDWQNYQKTMASRRLVSLEKKIRRRSKRLFGYIEKVKNEYKKWSGSESDFHQEKIRISEKYDVTKREFMNLEKNYFPILKKAEPKDFSRHSGT